VEIDDVAQRQSAGVEAGANLVEAEAELPERFDLLQARQFG